MKTLLTLFLFIGFFSNPDLATVRKNYPNAPKTELNTKDFFELLSDVKDSDDTVLVAYKAASIILVSKYEKKVSDKMAQFKEGALLLESTVAQSPNAIEIRLIRLSIQENVPGITKYKKNMDEDKKFITAHYNEQNSGMKAYIKSFVSQSKSFKPEEKQAFK